MDGVEHYQSEVMQSGLGKIPKSVDLKDLSEITDNVRDLHNPSMMVIVPMRKAHQFNAQDLQTIQKYLKHELEITGTEAMFRHTQTCIMFPLELLDADIKAMQSAIRRDLKGQRYPLSIQHSVLIR